MEKGEIGKSGDGFIDRSKVRILLCDNDEKSSQEVLTLLCKCSYQVTPVKSPRQVIDALNAEGPDIDIILSEVDLPMSKGMKMLKYIMRDKELRRIPVIMMSAQDEVSIVVKCLKFGAADYLVKPLRTNELLNLWTHMWRRRRMLGLAEKNIVTYDVDLVVSDPSDANTNSTTLFSDDTDEKPRKSTVPDPCTSKHQEGEGNVTTAAAPIEIDIGASSGCQPVDISGRSDSRTGPISPFLKKSELRIGESSAFFMYVKSSTVRSNNNPGSSSVHEHTPEPMKIVENLTIASTQVGLNIQGQINSETLENHSPAFNHPNSTSFRDTFSTEKACSPLVAPDIPQNRNLKEQSAQVHLPLKHDSPNNVPDFYAHTNYPYYMSGVVSQVQMQSASTYHNNLPNMHNHNNVNSPILPQYNHFPQCPPGMTPYPYYPPFGMCLQPGQMPAAQPWQSLGGPTSSERKVTKVDRREAALMKFRQKRKERCFDKKIRYVNRKKLAERRPRVRGQFVRKVNGVNVDLNDHPASAEEYEEDEDYYEEEDQSGNMDLCPDDDASFCPR